MKTISRDHNMQNRLNHCKQGRKYLYLYHEKSVYPVRVLRDKKADQAFRNGDWHYLQDLEASALGGINQ